MSKWVERFTRTGRAFRYAGAVAMITTGLFYVLYPPRTTSAFFDTTLFPQAWGLIIFASGFVTLWGMRTRILQVEQYGTLMFAIGGGLLALAQTLVMVSPPPTLTRGGGTFVLYCLVFLVTARYFELSADIRSAKLAQRIMEDR